MRFKKKGKISLFLSFIIILLIGVFIFFASGSNNESAQTPKLLQPFSFVANQITRPIFNLVQCKKKAERVNALINENTRLQGRLAQMKQIERENVRLRKELNVKSTEGKQKITAQVIGRSSSPGGQIALINKGKNQDIKKGDNVTLAGGILFGKVINTFSNYSKVIPITNESLSVAALQQTNQVEGILKGRGTQGDPIFDLMSPDKELKEGAILTSGLDQSFIPGLLIGNLAEVKFYPQENSKRGVVEPPFNFEQVNFVFIIHK